MDPVFGRPVKRLTNELGQASASEIYSKNGYFNANGTLVHHRSPSGHNIISTSTGEVVRAGVAFNYDSSFAPDDPDAWYYFAFGDTTLYKYSVSTGNRTVVKSFPGALAAMGGSIDWIDRTGRYMVLNIGGSTRVYDKSTDTLYTGSIPGSYGGAGGWRGISPDANYVITSTDGSPTTSHSWRIDHATKTVSMTPVLFWTACGGHGDVVSASNGKTYFVSFDCHTSISIYAIDVSLPQSASNVAQQLSQNRKLVQLTSWHDSGHFSRVSRGPLQDWMYVSVESGDDGFSATVSGWRAFKQEILKVNVLTGEVRRLAHHRSRGLQDSYYYQPRVSASWDGGVVLWTSNFGYNGRNYADLYAINVAPDGGSTPGRVNVAAQANGGVASASSTYSAAYAVTAVNDGDRTGRNWGSGGGWNDATPGVFPDFVTVRFNGPKIISEIDVFTVQDNFSAPVEPAEGMTFGLYGITGFEVEYWTGSQWLTVPNGSVSGNTAVWRRLTLAGPLTTDAIRLRITGALAAYSRIVEVEAWSSGEGPLPPSPASVNVALPAHGGVAQASSTYGAGYPVSAVNDGDRRGMNWGSGGGWNDATAASAPDWVEVAFSGPKTIQAISIFTLQDNFAAPLEPSAATTFSLYGITDFQVQYWTGAAWATVPGGDIRANRAVWRQLTFAPLTTTRIRIVVTGALAAFSRIVEIEAWSTGDAAPPPSINVAAQANGGMASASSTYSVDYPHTAVNDGDRKGLNWGHGGGWNDATHGASPDVVQVTFNGSKTISAVDVFTLQDNWQAPVSPTAAMTFSLYGATDFEIQYWTGAAWAPVPGGTITGNINVWRRATFAPLTTTGIRVVVTGALADYSRIVEVEAWGQ